MPVEPNGISALSVVASLGVFWNPVLALFFALTLDVLDGMVARARYGERREGKLADYACDRFSEFIIFGYYAATIAPLLAVIPIWNTLSAIRAVVGSGKIPVLPLRHLLLFYLLVF